MPHFSYEDLDKNKKHYESRSKPRQDDRAGKQHQPSQGKSYEPSVAVEKEPIPWWNVAPQKSTPTVLMATRGGGVE